VVAPVLRKTGFHFFARRSNVAAEAVGGAFRVFCRFPIFSWNLRAPAFFRFFPVKAV
jgi:hypothetical protein